MNSTRRMTLSRIEGYRRAYQHVLLQEMERQPDDRAAIRAAKVRMQLNLAHLSAEELHALQPSMMLEEQRASRHANAVIVT